jgi:hypothetical protein
MVCTGCGIVGADARPNWTDVAAESNRGAVERLKGTETLRDVVVADSKKESPGKRGRVAKYLIRTLAMGAEMPQ